MEPERGNTTIHLDHEAVVELVQKAFPSCKNVGRLNLLKGDAQNVLYSFKIGDETLVLRLYTRNKADGRREKELHALIKSALHLPELIYADENHHPWPFAIFRFVPGLRLKETPSSIVSTLSGKIGEILALIHSFKFPNAGFFEEGITVKNVVPIGSSPYLEKTLSKLNKNGKVRQRLGDELVDEMLEFINANRDFFPVIGDDTCLTHSDFRPANLLYQPGGNIIVLGWDFAHAGAKIMDFAVLLRHRHKMGLNVDAVLKGYAKHNGTLPEEWYRSALITDFLNMAIMLDAPVEHPAQFEELENVLRTTMSEWNCSKR